MVLAVVWCAGYQAVDFVLFQHQGAENHVVFQLLTRDRFGHAFVLTQFDQGPAAANHFRIDDFNAGAKLAPRAAAAPLISSGLPSRTQVAIPRRRRRRCGTRFVAFGDDTFAGFACQLGRRW